MNLSDLEHADRATLEDLFASEPVGALSIPHGRFTGTHLSWLPGRRPRVDWLHPIIWMGFDLLRFGIDFDDARWFFVAPRMRVGHFRASVGPSRWRDTSTVRLDYDVSRLPGPVRGLLYDEVKPLSDDLCLGIGGTNADRGEGERFFFALTRN